MGSTPLLHCKIAHSRGFDKLLNELLTLLQRSVWVNAKLGVMSGQIPSTLGQLFVTNAFACYVS